MKIFSSREDVYIFIKAKLFELFCQWDEDWQDTLCSMMVYLLLPAQFACLVTWYK